MRLEDYGFVKNGSFYEKTNGCCRIIANVDDVNDVTVRASLHGVDNYSAKSDLIAIYSSEKFKSSFEKDFNSWKKHIVNVYG